MKIIHAQSAVPTNEDGLVVYSGTYINTATSSTTVTITTELRSVFHCDIRAHRSVGWSNPPNFEESVEQLGVLESGGSPSPITIVVDCPGNSLLRYYIVGTTRLGVFRHPELTTGAEGAGTNRFIKHFKGILQIVGTSCTELVNTTGGNFTYTNPSTGSYLFTSDTDIFTGGAGSVKTICRVCLDEPGAGLTDVYMVLCGAASTKILSITVYKITPGDTSVVALAVLPSRLFVEFDIYP